MLRCSAPGVPLFQLQEVRALSNPLFEPLLPAGHGGPPFTERRRPGRSRLSLFGEARALLPNSVSQG